MAIYSNINGTTQSSFKIGANGVLLTSTANSSDQIPAKYLLTNQVVDTSAEDEDKVYFRLAFEKNDSNPLYTRVENLETRFDSFIPNKDITALEPIYEKENVGGVIQDKTDANGKKILLGISIKLKTTDEPFVIKNMDNMVEGPDSSTDDGIVLFNGTSGKKIKDSGKIIKTDAINETDTTNNATIPTTEKIVDYVGVLSEALKNRLTGIGKNGGTNGN